MPPTSTPTVTASGRAEAEVVDPVGVVGVFVGVEHGVDAIDPCIEQLFAEINAGVDQDSRRFFNALRPAFNKKRAAAAAVAGVGRIAIAPVIADARDAAGGTAAQNGRDDPVGRWHYFTPDFE